MHIQYKCNQVKTCPHIVVRVWVVLPHPSLSPSLRVLFVHIVVHIIPSRLGQHYFVQMDS